MGFQPTGHDSRLLNSKLLNFPRVRISKPQALFDLVPTSTFTLQQLTDIYNAARVDYVVPMPMNVAKLRDYVHHYDIDLTQSIVAMADYQPLGLSMLGRRSDTSWITRLGIIPNGRQRGVARRMMIDQLDRSRRLGHDRVVLEVIKDNVPAYRLFKSLGFNTTRELLIMRRPPTPVADLTHSAHINQLGHEAALQLLASRSDAASWVTATPSLKNVGALSALHADCPGLGKGWLVYQDTPLQLSRLTIKTEVGDPVKIATALLQELHHRHPVKDTVIENLPLDDPHQSAFEALGFITSFSRIEMHLAL